MRRWEGGRLKTAGSEREVLQRWIRDCLHILDHRHRSEWLAARLAARRVGGTWIRAAGCSSFKLFSPITARVLAMASAGLQSLTATIEIAFREEQLPRGIHSSYQFHLSRHLVPLPVVRLGVLERKP
jgi:hypothetical protein